MRVMCTVSISIISRYCIHVQVVISNQSQPYFKTLMGWGASVWPLLALGQLRLLGAVDRGVGG